MVITNVSQKKLSLIVRGVMTFHGHRTLISVNVIVNSQNDSVILSDHLKGLISSFGKNDAFSSKKTPWPTFKIYNIGLDFFSRK